MSTTTTDLTLSWNTLESVRPQLPLGWDALESVRSQLPLGWDALESVRSQLPLGWDCRRLVGQDSGSAWNVAAFVRSATSLRWVVCAMANPQSRGLASGPGRLPDRGSFIYLDEYGQLYRNDWQLVYDRTVLDLTVVTEQPYVWGEAPRGQYQGKNLYRRGIVTVHRMVIRYLPDGYELLAEGTSQYIDLVRCSYHCSPLPLDPFYYHLNQGLSDRVEATITRGPRLADPAVAGDSAAVWGEVTDDGRVSGDADTMRWIDVWVYPEF